MKPRCIAYHTGTRRRCSGRGTAPLYLCRKHRRGLVVPAQALIAHPAALRDLARKAWKTAEELK